jgi:hypothetical protein
LSDPKKFVLPTDREYVTREPELEGQWRKDFPEMLGFKNQGGVKIPKDFGWRTNPKQWQEEMTEQSLRTRRRGEIPQLPATNPEVTSPEPSPPGSKA